MCLWLAFPPPILKPLQITSNQSTYIFMYCWITSSGVTGFTLGTFYFLIESGRLLSQRITAIHISLPAQVVILLQRGWLGSMPTSSCHPSSWFHILKYNTNSLNYSHLDFIRSWDENLKMVYSPITSPLYLLLRLFTHFLQLREMDGTYSSRRQSDEHNGKNRCFSIWNTRKKIPYIAFHHNWLCSFSVRFSISCNLTIDEE